MNALKNETRERITIYCTSREQQESIRNKLDYLRLLTLYEKNATILENALVEYIKYLKNKC